MKNSLLKNATLIMISAAMILSVACDNRNEDDSPSNLVSGIDTDVYSEQDTAPVVELNGNNYIGYWHMADCAEIELTIDSVTSTRIVFSLWQFSDGAVGPISAELTGNNAVFQTDEISGTITLNDNSISLLLTSTDLNIRLYEEMIFDMRVLESVKGNDGSFISATPVDSAGVISDLPRTLYGQINCKGQNVSGMTAEYVCDGGEYSTVRKQLGDKWHIRTDCSCYNYGTLWYECYDSEDGDYYGWVDADYLILTDTVTSPTDNLTYIGTGSVSTNDGPLFIRSAMEYTEEGKIGQIPQNASGFSVYDCGEPNWYYVEYNGIQGYVSSAFIKVNASAGNSNSHETNSQTVTSVKTETVTVPTTTAPKYKPEVKSLEVHGITFNYVSDFNRYYEYLDETADFKMNVSVKYCEPDDYLSPDCHIVGIMSTTGMYDKKDIGNLYYSAGTDDFVIFEVRFVGTYSGVSSGGIKYRKFMPSGVPIANYRGDLIMQLIEPHNTEGTMDETIYIGFYTSEVGSIDFIMFDIAPDYEY